MAFEYLEDLSLADIGFRATGADPVELFSSAWEAVLRIMIRDPSSLRPRETRTVTAEEDDLELLLHGFLETLLYFHDAQGILLRVERLDVSLSPCKLEAQLVGELLDPNRHDLGTGVKAVTWHHFSVVRQATGWEAVVVVDV